MVNQRIEDYRRIREAARDYLSGLINRKEYADVDPVFAGKLLGIYRSGKMLFDSESEVSTLMDFSIAEKLSNGKSIIDREIESNKQINEEIWNILEAFRSSYTSLFEVIGLNKNECTVQLYDLLKDEDKEIIDISLSQSARKDGLLFFRIVAIKDFAMTSGMSFGFSKECKDILLRRYRSEIRSRFKIDKSITRFLIFHRLNREFGEHLLLI
jgi:hypothetical protein